MLENWKCIWHTFLLMFAVRTAFSWEGMSEGIRASPVRLVKIIMDDMMIGKSTRDHLYRLI